MNESRINRRQLLATATGALATTYSALAPSLLMDQAARGEEQPAGIFAHGLVGYWPLEGDCQDQSGLGNHGTAHGDGSENGQFDGRGKWIEIRPSDSLKFGTEDFTLAVWVWTAPDIDDVIGDVLTKYDSQRRRGFNLIINSSAGGYSSHGDDRHVYFGIDDGSEPTWVDCGRPSPTSNYVSNSLTVFDGNLYAAITDAEKEEDWCHVFRYGGDRRWEDCGRVGNRRTHGVGPMVVHRGHLYAGTWTYDWTRVGRSQPLDDFCSVYRYAGGTTWEDCGQPGSCRRLFGLASFRGQVFVTAVMVAAMCMRATEPGASAVAFPITRTRWGFTMGCCMQAY